MTPVALRCGQHLYEPDTRIEYVYFPTTAMISLLLMTEDGESAEVGTIDRSGMLGVRRSALSTTAKLLQDEGVISYHRGRIKILRRGRLEEYSCGCYKMVKEEIEHFYPTQASPG